MQRHLVLIGLVGADRSTVGAVVAHRLGRTLYDSDVQIEAAIGRTVMQVLADEGLAAMRDHEVEALFEALADREPGVIAAAAGVVLADDHRARLRDADAVWLTAAPEMLAPRTAARDHRPWLDDDALGTLQRMDRERAPVYDEVAVRTVDVDGLTPERIADRILA